MQKTFQACGENFIKYVNSSRTAFHAVDTTRKRLSAAGFVELSEKTPFDVVPGGKYWFTRNQSSIVAFSVGNKWKNGNGFNMVGAHTDSPCLSYGYNQVGVELYGGGLWYTWFDRDLTVGGRVLVQTDAGGYESRLVYINKPILRVPSLAIHLDRTVNTDGFKFNQEVATVPVLETAIKSAFQTPADASHNSALMNLIAKTLDISAEKIVNFELTLCDCQDAVIGGINDEFIFSGRLDNLMSSFCAVEALIETSTKDSLDKEENVRMIVLFDHEEIGSQSAYGANSPLVGDAMQRIAEALTGGKPDIFASKTNSFLISADMAHAVHPNFGEKHENNHRPYMHKGPVIKSNANQRYATTSETSLVIEHLSKKHNIPYQKFVVRNDAPCGSTIGPILSSELGVRTVDIGNPQLSMHSIREMCGVDDTYHCVELLKAFFEGFAELNKTIKID